MLLLANIAQLYTIHTSLLSYTSPHPYPSPLSLTPIPHPYPTYTHTGSRRGIRHGSGRVNSAGPGPALGATHYGSRFCSGSRCEGEGLSRISGLPCGMCIHYCYDIWLYVCVCIYAYLFSCVDLYSIYFIIHTYMRCILVYYTIISCICIHTVAG